MVDTGKIAMRPAVELSYLPPEQQQTILETIESEESTPSHVQAMKMRKFSEERISFFTTIAAFNIHLDAQLKVLKTNDQFDFAKLFCTS